MQSAQDNIAALVSLNQGNGSEIALTSVKTPIKSFDQENPS